MNKTKMEPGGEQGFHFENIWYLSLDLLFIVIFVSLHL
jgi:hypothetical protein